MLKIGNLTHGPVWSRDKNQYTETCNGRPAYIMKFWIKWHSLRTNVVYSACGNPLFHEIRQPIKLTGEKPQQCEVYIREASDKSGAIYIT